MSVVYLPPPTLRLPAELRRAVRKAAGGDQRRLERLARAARREWLEYGLPEALERLRWWGR